MSNAIRDALAELVALQELKGEESRLRQRRECSLMRKPNSRATADSMRDEYNRRKPFAWAAARSALAEKPAMLTDEQITSAAIKTLPMANPFDTLYSFTEVQLFAFARAIELEATQRAPTLGDGDVSFISSVLDDVLGDISDWEDRALSEAVTEAKSRIARAIRGEK